MTRILLTLLVATAALGWQAHAGLLLEPYGGYANGSVNLEYSSSYATPSLQNTTDSGSINGFVYGGRAGFLIHHFLILGADYQDINAKQKMNSSTTQLNWNQQTWFGVFGFQAPRGFRLMGGYGWSFQADQATTPDTTWKGTAYKLLVGWHLPMPVAINVEYTIYNMTSYTSAGATTQSNSSFSKLNYASTMVTLSFPFDLFHMGGGGHHSSSNTSSPY